MKLLSVVGARPNFMKIAPMVRALARRRETPIEHVLVHTGQHYDPSMSEIFFKELGIPAPNFNLQVGSGTHAEQTAKVMLAFEPICSVQRPDWVVVVGDVNSTMACALVAAKLGIKVAHIEAGLRSFDRTMPEEINRIVTDSLADLLLTPSLDADDNLRREGVASERIRCVGNVMIDTLCANLADARRSSLPDSLAISPKQFAYVTLHRPSNVDHRDTLERILASIVKVSESIPVVFVVHPRTRSMMESFGLASVAGHNLKLIDPVGYRDSLYLTENARFVLTDSGGLQEESTYLRTPCLTLRPNTERPVTIMVGTNKLTRVESLAADIDEIMRDSRPSGGIPPYWDGHAADRILDALLELRSPSANRPCA